MTSWVLLALGIDIISVSNKSPPHQALFLPNSFTPFIHLLIHLITILKKNNEEEKKKSGRNKENPLRMHGIKKNPPMKKSFT